MFKSIDANLTVNFEFTLFKPAVIDQISFTHLVINFGRSGENSSSSAIH